MIKSSLAMITAGTILLGSTAAGFAQAIEFGPNGVRVVPPGQERIYEERVRRDVGPREAAAAARDAGIYEVDDILTRRNSYKVVGVDRRGRMLEVDVSRRTGEILGVNRI